MPFFTAVAANSLPAATYNANVRDQVITTCTSGTRPATPAEGQFIYETDTDLLYCYTGSVWIQMGATGAWESWTPTVTQSGSVTVTNTRSVFNRVGRRVDFTSRLTVTGSGTGGNAVLVSTPVTAAASGQAAGYGQIVDQSGFTYQAILYLSTTTSFALHSTSFTGGLDPRLGVSSFTAALANTDTITISGTIEAAS